MWKRIVLITSLFLNFVSAARADDAPKLDAYFPLTAGTTWKYSVTVKLDKAEPQTKEQSVKVELQRHGNKSIAVISDNAYATQEDGVYITGIIRDGKLEPLDEPQKVVPANPKLGDRWTYRELAGVTSASCLGTETIKVGAGEYDAAKVYLITVGGTDGADRREVYRWFAAGVGPVKGSITQHRKNADGSTATIEMTMELSSYELAKTAAATDAAKPTVESLFAQAEAAARKGDHKTALEKYDAALAIEPKAAKVHAYKTLSLIATKQFTAGETEIKQAIALDNKEYTYQEIAGQLKVAQGDIQAGKSLYDKAAALSPKSAGAIYTDLGAALAQRADDKLSPEIEKALKTAAAADPPGAEALFALGQSYVNAGRAEGRKYLQRYVEVASALPDAKRDDQKIRLAKQLIRAIDAVKGGP
jgi:tetratricopeptide (TPR) repeat protein